MVGKCDASPNGDFCNVSLSRLLWFTGLFSVMTIKDDNQNEINLTQWVGQKRERKAPTLPPRATREKNRPWTVVTWWKHEPDRHEREQQERPFPCAGSPSTRLPCPRNPFGTCPGTWWTNRNQSENYFRCNLLLFYLDHSVQSDTSQARGHSTEQLILLNGNVYCDGISWGMMMSTVKWNVLRNETKYYRQQANWKVSGKWGRAYREL